MFDVYIDLIDLLLESRVVSTNQVAYSSAANSCRITSVAFSLIIIVGRTGKAIIVSFNTSSR